MERIKLSKTEKKVMCHLYKYDKESLDDFSRFSVENALHTLECKGFVKVAWIEGGGFDDVRITNVGMSYVRNNPRLSNPIDWSIVAAVTGIIAAVAAIAALFVGCCRII